MKLLCSAIVLLSTGGTLCAQEKDDGQPKTPAGRITWFVATSIPDDLENPVSVMAGTQITEVTLSNRSTSDPIKVPADGIIRMVRKVENPQDPAKPTYVTLAQALVPEGVSKSLIILGANPKKEGSDLVFLTKVQDLAGFKGGDYLYMNLTTLNVAVQLGKEKIGLKPGESSIFDGKSSGRATNIDVSYYFMDPAVKDWKLINSSTMVQLPTRREICIFSWDPRYERVNCSGITVPVVP